MNRTVASEYGPTKSRFEWPPVLPDSRAIVSRSRLSLGARCVKLLLFLIPQNWRVSLYDALSKAGPPVSTPIPSFRAIFRLPFGLVLKIVSGKDTVEADALRLVNRVSSVHTPHLVDSVVSPHKSYLLTTWIEGDNIGDMWDNLSESDRLGIANDLGNQFRLMRLQTASPSTHLICNASDGPIEDPRVPWVGQECPRTFSSCHAFAKEVWTGLDWEINKGTLKPLLTPLIERDVPIVFSHGDLLPRNLIFPGGIDSWRSGRSRICVIDWELAGWMPIYWDALKMTWMDFEQDTEWIKVARDMFPECEVELNADWEWRSRSRVLIL